MRSVYAAGTRYLTPRIEAEATALAMLAVCLRSNVEFIPRSRQCHRSGQRHRPESPHGGAPRSPSGRRADPAGDRGRPAQGAGRGRLSGVRCPDDGLGGPQCYRRRTAATRPRPRARFRSLRPRTDRAVRPSHQDGPGMSPRHGLAVVLRWITDPRLAIVVGGLLMAGTAVAAAVTWPPSGATARPFLIGAVLVVRGLALPPIQRHLVSRRYARRHVGRWNGDRPRAG